MVYGHGINDMKRGWLSENKKNYRLYHIWRHMLERVYSEKFHEKRPTYKNCSVCERWLLLSNFVDDYKLIDGYEEEKFLKGELELDKDIKSNGANKEYSLENCMWTSKEENVRQAMKTRDNNYLQGENNTMYGKTGENNPMYGRTGKDNSLSIKVSQYDKQGNLIKIWNCISDIQRELGIDHSHISICCQFYEMNCNKEKWLKTHKNNPRKSAGGFVFKYYKKDDKK